MPTSPPPQRRYPTDLTDAQWQLIVPLLPPPTKLGRHEKHPRREIVNAILYIVRAGCAWRMLPKDLPPWQTVFWYFSPLAQRRHRRPHPQHATGQGPRRRRA